MQLPACNNSHHEEENKFKMKTRPISLICRFNKRKINPCSPKAISITDRAIVDISACRSRSHASNFKINIVKSNRVKYYKKKQVYVDNNTFDFERISEIRYLNK